MSETPRLDLPLLAEAQASPEIPVNIGLYALDALVQGAVIRRDLTSPPGSPAEGDAYIIAAPGTGEWDNRDDQVAAFQNGGWVYYVPREGWRLWCVADGTFVRYGVGSPSTWTPDTSDLQIATPGSPTTVIFGVTRIYFDNATVEDNGDGSVLVTPGTTVGATPCELQIALSDLTTDLTTGTTKAYMRAPFAFTLTEVRASLLTDSSSGVVTVDINEAGVSILSTKLTIDASEKTSTTAATPAVISDPDIADDAELTFDIDTAGTGAAGLIVTLKGLR